MGRVDARRLAGGGGGYLGWRRRGSEPETPGGRSPLVSQVDRDVVDVGKEPTLQFYSTLVDDDGDDEERGKERDDEGDRKKKD